jgi:isocitrate dehydrogenase
VTRDGPSVWAGIEHRDNYRGRSPGKGIQIASIFAWTRGLIYRGKFDNTPDMTAFAETLKKVCIETVEAGHMTRDLSTLIGPEQPWMTTQAFLGKLGDNLQKVMK